MDKNNLQSEVKRKASIVGGVFFVVSGAIVYLAISFIEQSPDFIKEWSGVSQGAYCFGGVTVLKLIQSFINYACTEDNISDAVDKVMKEDDNLKSEDENSKEEKK
jgi:hypothetical protein